MSKFSFDYYVIAAICKIKNAIYDEKERDEILQLCDDAINSIKMNSAKVELNSEYESIF